MQTGATAAANQYGISVTPVDGTVAAIGHDGEVLAQSTAARVMHETRLPAAVYFPARDVRVNLSKNEKVRSFCPFKGTATYFDIEAANGSIAAGAWSYMNALPESRDIEGYLGFMPIALARIDGAEAHTAERFDGHISGPTIDWVMREAWACASPEELTAAIARRFLDDGIAVSRLSILIWSLHPQIAARNYLWTKADDRVETRTPSYDLLTDERFINSPLRHVANGLGGVRQRLNTDETEFSFAIMDDLRAAGGTDYVAMPLPFSNGQINVMTLTSDHPDGFTTANLGLVFECSPVISRFYEVFTLQENAAALLETYLGKRTGARVLGGEIRRGDGDEIDAAVLFCDLRGSSKLEGSLERDDYLRVLNHFFETATGIVHDHGGEVLKFVGDAVLAIFPVTGDEREARDQALKAAHEIAGLMVHPVPGSDVTLECAIGISFGNVTYGNVGHRERLDFTVIGTPANVAARLSDLGKQLGHTIVTSAEFADSTFARMNSLGHHDLHNVSPAVEALTVRGTSPA